MVLVPSFNNTPEIPMLSANHVCVDFPVPDGGDAYDVLLIEGSIGEVLVSKELRIRLVSVGRTFVQTDKYLYEEGQSVKFRVLSVEGERAAISYEDLDEVWVTSPTETRLVQWLNVSNSRGLVQLEFPLAEHVQESYIGSYIGLIPSLGVQFPFCVHPGSDCPALVFASARDPARLIPVPEAQSVMGSRRFEKLDILVTVMKMCKAYLLTYPSIFRLYENLHVIHFASVMHLFMSYNVLVNMFSAVMTSRSSHTYYRDSRSLSTFHLTRLSLRLTVEVCADYTYGQPVTGSGNLFVKTLMYYYYEGDQRDDALVIPIPTFSGCTDVEVDTSLIDTGSHYVHGLALTADITEEGTGHMASGAATLKLASQRLSFAWISRGKDAKPGLPLEMQIQARFPDQSGAPDVEVTACVETACKDFVTDEHGVFTVIVPPHLVKPRGKLKVTLTNEDDQQGHLGNLHPSVGYFYFDVYYSESNSSLSLVIPTDAVDCTPGGDISLSLPVLFVANNINQALMRLQVISRSQVILVDSFVQDLVASDLPLDEDALLEPMADLEDGFVRGSFSVQLELPYYASPSVNVLICIPPRPAR
nr:uncharacterized protein LOC113808063 [Penaeus vannamei]